MPPFLDVRNVRKDFLLHILNEKTIPALADVSFTMDAGEVLGLTGKSGSGKSSLMKCIYRTYLVSSGEIFFDSSVAGVIDLASAPEHEVLRVRRTDMTYCSQFLSVIPRVTAVDVVAARLINRGGDADAARETARDLLERLGLPNELWDAYPSTFSGGEQQRINVAQAIIARPRFLLIDEPTASLDPRTKDVVIDMILDLKERGTGVILITHDKHTLERMADRQLNLVEGRLEEVAPAT
ncbi:MAG: phosphonate C-P lyase system protein PhnL [Opitutales bacterium]